MTLPSEKVEGDSAKIPQKKWDLRETSRRMNLIYFSGIFLWTWASHFTVLQNLHQLAKRCVEKTLSPKYGIFGRGEVRAEVRWVSKNKMKKKIQEDCILKMERNSSACHFISSFCHLECIGSNQNYWIGKWNNMNSYDPLLSSSANMACNKHNVLHMRRKLS